MPNTLVLTTRLHRSHIPLAGGEVHLLIQVAAPAQDAPGTDPARLPLNLAAVVDRSGSMAGAKLHYTRQALTFLVDQVAPQDRLAVVTFDDQVDVVTPSQPIIHKDILKAHLGHIETGGSTNLSGGLATGMQQISPHAGPARVSRVLLMTDGLANVGVTDPQTLTGWATGWREQGLTLSTLGVGDDFNEDLLVAMAEAGGGNFHYIENPDRIPALFAAELQGLLQVAGQALRLRVSAAPGVAITAVVGYPPTGTPHATDLALPDIYAGETKPILLTLAVAAPPGPGAPLVRIVLDYLPAVAGATPQSLAADVVADFTADPALLAAPPDAEVDRQLGLARAAQAREEAIRRADAGDFSGSADVLAGAEASLAYLVGAGDAEAAAQVRSLHVAAAQLRSSGYDAGLRKRMKHQSHQTRSGRRTQ